jgi:hypothetical protein
MKTVLHSDHFRRSRDAILMPLLWLCAGIAIGIVLRSIYEKPQPLPMQEPAIPAARVEPARSNIQRAARAEPIVPALEQLRALTSGRSFDLGEALLLIRKLELADCKPALRILRQVPADERPALLDALAKRWAALDPADAFTTAQHERSDNDWRNRLGYAAGAALVMKDPEAALERITNARNGDLREKAAEWVLRALGKTDPKRAAEYLTSNKHLSRHRQLLFNLANEFGSVSPREAMAWAQSLPKNQFREECIALVWQGWAQADPARVAAELANASDARLLPNTAGVVARHWSRSDPDAALAWISSLDNEEVRNAALGNFDFNLETMGTKGASKILEAAASERFRNEFAANVAQQIARDDLQEALSWAESLPAEKGRTAAISSVVNQWTTDDPAGAVRFIAELPEGKERSETLTRALNSWADTEPDAAYAYALALPAGEERDKAMVNVIGTARRTEPEKALTWFESLENPAVAGQLAQGFAESLIKTDPAAALKLVSQVPVEGQPQAYWGLVRGWAFDHPQEAGEWVKNLPPGEARDSAVKAYVSVIDGMDAGVATKWAYSIAEPTERMEVTMSVFQRWLQNDRTAARDWVEQTPLPEGFRPFFDRLLNDRKYAERMRD